MQSLIYNKGNGNKKHDLGLAEHFEIRAPNHLWSDSLFKHESFSFQQKLRRKKILKKMQKLVKGY